MANRLLISIGLILVIMGCSSKKDIPDILQRGFKTHVIYFEEPKPSFNLERDNLKEILVLLHSRVNTDKIKEHFQMNDSVWNERLNLLYGEGLVKKLEDGNFVPSCFVLDTENSSQLKRFSDSIGTEMSGIIIDRLNKIKEAYKNIPSLKAIPFDNISLFLLGSVMHDKWQMSFYHEQFIKAFAPHRGSARYYLALIQNDESMKQSVNIYETKFYDYPSFQFGSFSLSGTERSIRSYATSELVKYFGKGTTVGDSIFQVILIDELIKIQKNPNHQVPAEIAAGFKSYGLIIEGKSVVPYLSKSDQSKLSDLASVLSTDILNYFENRQTSFVKYFLNSPYSEETSYKEWMVWLYKFITAKTVDVLIQKSLIKEPAGRTASFIFEK